MDIFRLNDTGTTWAEGTIINGLTTKLWSERYRSPGEFKFTAPPTKSIMDSLPLGALVSHTETLDVMIVESHEIIESQEKDPEISITGRSLDSFLEQRVATEDHLGFNNPMRDGSPSPYIFDQSSQTAQIRALIRSGIQEGYVARSVFALPHTVVTIRIGDLSFEEEREVKRGPLYDAVMDLLAEMDAGLKIERPNGTKTDIHWVVHDGDKVLDKVQFSHDAGDLEASRYFRTNKTDKNSAYAMASYGGIYWGEAGSTGASGLLRRVMYLDATDIKLNPIPNDPYGVVAARIEEMLTKRAKRVVKRRKKTDILEATVSKDSRFKYRRDYNIGDLVWVLGNYDTSDIMRVVEYVESEDENGEKGFPTLVRATGAN